jgi:predicted CopG family antitoxin
MGVKTISIRDEIYEKLRNARREGESFSDAIDRLLKRDRADLSKYFGALKESDLLDELEEDSRKMRENARQRF